MPKLIESAKKNAVKIGLAALTLFGGVSGLEELDGQTTTITVPVATQDARANAMNFLQIVSKMAANTYSGQESTLAQTYGTEINALKLALRNRVNPYGGDWQSMFSDMYAGVNSGDQRWNNEFNAAVNEAQKLRNADKTYAANLNSNSSSLNNGGVGVVTALSPEEQARQQNEIDFNKLVTLEYRIKTYDIAQDSEFRNRLKAKYRKERFKDDVAGAMRDGLEAVKGILLGGVARSVDSTTAVVIREIGANSRQRHNQQETQRDFNETSAEFQEIMAAIGAGTYDARHWQDKKFALIEQRDALIDALSDRGVDAQTIKKLQENGQKLAKRDVDALELKQGKAAPSRTNTPDEKTKENSASDQNKIKALEQKKKAVQTELNDFFDSFDGIEMDSLKGNKLEKFEKGVLKDFDRLSPEAQDAINTIFREEESNGAKRTDKRKVKFIMDARDTDDHIRQDILDAVEINGLGAIQKSSDGRSAVASLEGGGSTQHMKNALQEYRNANANLKQSPEADFDTVEALVDTTKALNYAQKSALAGNDGDAVAALYGRQLTKKEAISEIDRLEGRSGIGPEEKSKKLPHMEGQNAAYLNRVLNHVIEETLAAGKVVDSPLIKKNTNMNNGYVAGVAASRSNSMSMGV